MFKILGTYQNKTKEIDTADTMSDAKYLAQEYRIAYGMGWTICVQDKNNIKHYW